jgi:type II secretory pathway component PulC
MKRNSLLRLFIYGLLAFCLTAGFWAYQTWNKPHRNYSAESSAQAIDAAELFEAFRLNPENAQAQFGDQIIEISGIAAASEDSYVVLEPGVVCRWESVPEFAAPLGEAVQVKARVLGFDDLMGEVSADHALLLP